jgi:hypothetical protein
MLAANLLTPRSKILIDTLIDVQLVKTFPAFYETRGKAINKHNVYEKISTLSHFSEVFKRKGMLAALKVNDRTSINRNH